MQFLSLSLLLLGGAIIFGLSIYAGWLLAKLHRQNQLQAKMHELAIDKRNANIVESVDTIALAALQQQCDLSEAAIRLFMIMDHLQGKLRVEFPVSFPALFELYEVVKDMPRGEARKATPKKERMKLDMVRVQAEVRLQQAIKEELQEILIFTGAKSSPLPNLAN